MLTQQGTRDKAKHKKDIRHLYKNNLFITELFTKNNLHYSINGGRGWNDKVLGGVLP